MAATDATSFVVKNQPYRLYFVILDNTTGNPVTGGLTALAGTRSLDGAAFASTSATPVEIGTTGFGYVDLVAAETNTSATIVHITASNATALYFNATLFPVVLSEEDDAWDDQTVMRLEQAILQGAAYSLNKVTITNADENGAGTITLYKRDGTTVWLTGTVSDDGTVTMKGTLA